MHHNNLLIKGLDQPTFEKISRVLISVSLEQGQQLAHPHQSVQRVYFPEGGVISCVVELPGGGAIETGMIGRDGQWGASQAMDDKVSLNAVTVQVPGKALAMDADRLRQLALELPSFRSLLLRYDQFFLAQVQQTAACNAVHQVAPRLCKWLLRLRELAGADFLLTQEFMAQMMGVRRTSVTVIATELQKLGAITYSRGHIHVSEPALLEAQACECTAEVQSHYETLFGGEEPRSS
jgi:CRP-like cAMP-binding protein